MQSVDKGHLWPLTWRQWAALAAALLALWTWRQGQLAGCISLLIPLAVTALNAAYGREYALRRRACLVACHLRDDTSLARWLNGRGWITLRAVLIALVSVPSMMLALLIWPDVLLAALLLDLPLIVLLVWIVSRWAQRWVATDMVQVIGKRWVVLFNALILLLALTLTQLYLPFSDRVALGLVEAVKQAAEGVSAQTIACPLTLTGLQLAAQFDTLNWWLMERGTAQLESSALRLLAWVGFLLMNSLVAWTFSRFLVQVMFLGSSPGRKPSP